MVRLLTGLYNILCLHLLQSRLADLCTIYSYLLCQWHPGMFADKKNTSSDSSKPAFQFGGNNVIFGGKKDAPVDSSKPFQFGPNNGIFGDKKDTPSDSNKPFHFGANKGIFGDKKTTSGDSSNPF